MVQFVSMLAWLVKALQCVHARVPSYVQPLRYGELFRITISIQALFHFWAALPIFSSFFTFPLQWLHDGRDGVSNHQPHDCLLNPLFKRWSKKTSKLRVTGLCTWSPPVTGEFPAQMASNAKNVSIWWRHHAQTRLGAGVFFLNFPCYVLIFIIIIVILHHCHNYEFIWRKSHDFHSHYML